jgi:hypothetical protein
MATICAKKVMTGDEMPAAGGRPRSLNAFRKVPKVRNVPTDALGRHLLTLFMLRPNLIGVYYRSSCTLNDVGAWLNRMGPTDKTHLLARLERTLKIPRTAVRHLPVIED